jgi:hypothetical protein
MVPLSLKNLPKNHHHLLLHPEKQKHPFPRKQRRGDSGTIGKIEESHSDSTSSTNPLLLLLGHKSRGLI